MLTLLHLPAHEVRAGDQLEDYACPVPNFRFQPVQSIKASHGDGSASYLTFTLSGGTKVQVLADDTIEVARSNRRIAGLARFDETTHYRSES
jgi:hypothetical protein